MGSTRGDEHPALRYWRSVDPHGAPPTAITVLKESRPKARLEKQKSSVYRLEGVGPRGSPIIAKRCQRGQAALERSVYQGVLAGLSIPLLTCHGFAEEPDGRFGWLFLEDAGDRAFSPHVREHRVAAARWLAALHTATAEIAQTLPLPDRGPSRYREDLRTAIGTIRRLIDGPSLGDFELTTLEAVLLHCEAVDAHWSEVQAACDALPSTLVHGDFVTKNIRVRSDTRGLAALAFDWEHAGWGSPLSDLAQSPSDSTRFAAGPDVETYCKLVRERWPRLDALADERFAHLGTLFRLLLAIGWEVRNVAGSRPTRGLDLLARYEGWAAEVLRNLDFDGPGRRAL